MNVEEQISQMDDFIQVTLYLLAFLVVLQIVVVIKDFKTKIKN